MKKINNKIKFNKLKLKFLNEDVPKYDDEENLGI